MDKIEEIDALKFKLAHALEDRAKLAARVAEFERIETLYKLALKYKLDSIDQINWGTLEINRPPSEKDAA